MNSFPYNGLANRNPGAPQPQMTAQARGLVCRSDDAAGGGGVPPLPATAFTPVEPQRGRIRLPSSCLARDSTAALKDAMVGRW